MVARPRDLPDRVAQAGKSRVDARIDELACVSQLDRARAPMKQRDANLLLQSADLMAECGRRHMQLVGGAREAQMPGDRLEGPQRVERRHRTRIR